MSGNINTVIGVVQDFYEDGGKWIISRIEDLLLLENIKNGLEKKENVKILLDQYKSKKRNGFQGHSITNHGEKIFSYKTVPPMVETYLDNKMQYLSSQINAMQKTP